MFGSFLRPQKARRSEQTPLLAALRKYRTRNGDDDDDGSGSDEEDAFDNVVPYEDEDGDDDDEDDSRGHRDGPLLPVFSELLDRIPIYATTHSIRILVIQKCETTLSWDQLRSPQVSQFLVKPIQQRILANHFSRGTLYCLIANCLQFRREANEQPANMGISKTRALICELLALRLLKEWSTRELIDALSYDFDPLQGMAMPATAGTMTPGGSWARLSPRSARISTLEVAIRAQAKKFLAHPLVVQQLEAIWAGTIVFHSIADNLHRSSAYDSSRTRHGRQYSTFDTDASPRRGPPRNPSPAKPRRSSPESYHAVRRTVTLYDPHEASLFKLSRLRVPRYRNLYSTLSFAIMLGLFLAVLVERSDDITALEVLFWFWSAGYMLDEIVGFSEQGFGLYIMSVWNAFDLGILLLFLIFYVFRLYGILMPDAQKHDMARMAYDVLGATAVLLFPRLFSALDHYRYFSQLLIAFRMMAMDLVAILLLIIICCSGFFVAFVLAFKKDFDASHAAYALFQMVMGFTPAAWDIWNDFNLLGKGLLTLFLFICHFLIVTILITVLTNSFMAIVQNANEEHQFLFAVNTISMVKSDALFSYIPPTNIVGWLVIPLKYTMPFRRFIRMNRLIIKITHIPILFTIFLYERLLLSNLSYGPTDLVEQRGRSGSKVAVPAFSFRGPVEDIFSPGARLREPSITTFRKDRALEEVFRRPFREPSVPAAPNPLGRRNSSNVVTDWMKGMGPEGETSPPQEDARSTLDRLESRIRPSLRRTKTSGQAQKRRRHPLAPRRVTASDPDDISMSVSRAIMEEEEPDMSMSIEELPQQTDADGDDELLTNDEDDKKTLDRVIENTGEGANRENKRPQTSYDTSDDEFFRTPMTIKPRTPARTSSPVPSYQAGTVHVSPSKKAAHKKPGGGHHRNLSTNTVLFSPNEDTANDSRTASPSRRPPTSGRSGNATPGRILADGARRPATKHQHHPPLLSNTPVARPRPIMPPRNTGATRTTPNIASFLALDQRRRDPSFSARALDLASDLGDNRHGPDFSAVAIPASLTTQLEMAARMKARNRERGRGGIGTDESSDDDSQRMSRIMLARMTTLEEGFRDVLKEVKGLKKGSEDGGAKNASGGISSAEAWKRKKGKRKVTRRESEGEGNGEEAVGAGQDRGERIGSSL